MPETPSSLAGELTVLPGAPRGANLRSSRPDWVGRLTPGQPLDKLPDLLATVFSQCGEAHRLCAHLAIEAARGDASPVPAAARQRLHMETLREHLRRITLDWPRRLAPSGSAESWRQRAVDDLRQAPVLPGAALDAWMQGFDALGPWLARAWLGMSAAAWLAHWQRDARGWLAQWSSSTQGWLPELLRVCREPAEAVHGAAPALRVHDDADQLCRFAEQLQSGQCPAREPVWRGACAETGAWTRLAEAAPEIFDTPWLRLGARLAEAVQLANASTQRLAAGRLALDKNAGLAWVEMARGLLIHRVCIDGERVAHCDVIAPTEWNFHPRGAVAQGIEALAPAFSQEGVAEVLLPPSPLAGEGLGERGNSDQNDTLPSNPPPQPPLPNPPPQGGREESGHCVAASVSPAGASRIAALMTAYDPCVDFRVIDAQERAHA